MHEAKFRWALEVIREGTPDPAELAAEVLASAEALDQEMNCPCPCHLSIREGLLPCPACSPTRPGAVK